MSEWRECVFAGKEYERSTYGGFPPGPIFRDCSVINRTALPSRCAACPVPADHHDAELWRKHGPALVAAVKAVAEWDAMFDPPVARESQRIAVWAGAERLIKAALAALPPEEEADEDVR